MVAGTDLLGLEGASDDLHAAIGGLPIRIGAHGDVLPSVLVNAREVLRDAAVLITLEEQRHSKAPAVGL